jgi:hypothetical protein
MHTNAVATALNSIALGPSIVVDNLTMIPLIPKGHPRSSTSTPSTSTPSTSTVSTPATSGTSTVSTPGTVSTHSPSPLDYAILDDALASGAVEITEISDQGSVPDLRVVNRGPQPVLIVDGEELLGAKQNRVVNLSILVPAQSELTIPVSCVEAGRWRARSKSFKAAPRTQYATGRAKRMVHVSYSMAANGDRVSNQADVWQDIAAMSVRLNAESPTSAMEAIFHRHDTSIVEYVERCRPVDGQVGAVFAVGDRLIGFDLFDRPSTLKKVMPKLVRSVAVDAIDAASRSENGHRGARPDDRAIRLRAEQFLAVTGDVPQHVTRALGLGEDARMTAPGIAGAALVNEAHVVHLSAFAL